MYWATAKTCSVLRSSRVQRACHIMHCLLQGQSPSDKYTQQAKQYAGSEAAEKIANSPDINVGGGSMGKGEYQAGNQAKAGRGSDTYKDIRDGTPGQGSKAAGQVAPKLPGWMNVLDLSAAPIASPDAAADNDKKV